MIPTVSGFKAESQPSRLERQKRESREMRFEGKNLGVGFGQPFSPPLSNSLLGGWCASPFPTLIVSEPRWADGLRPFTNHNICFFAARVFSERGKGVLEFQRSS